LQWVGDGENRKVLGKASIGEKERKEAETRFGDEKSVN